jgi:hypothetical protein
MLNMCGWFYLAYHPTSSVSTLFVFSFFLGLIGGMCYANTMVQLISSDAVASNLKELSLNIGVFCIDLGVLCSAVGGILTKYV